MIWWRSCLVVFWLPLLKTCAAGWFANCQVWKTSAICLVARAADYFILMLEDDHGANMRLAKLGKLYREWAWGPRLVSNWWMPARNWSSPNSCSVGQDSSNTGDKTQVLKVSYLKSTLSRLDLLHKKPHHSHQLSCFLEQATQTFWVCLKMGYTPNPPMK